MVVGIVLAAGMSVRMGEFKQLLPLRGNTVVEHVVKQVLGSLETVIVVLGHRADEVSAVLADKAVKCVYNPHYAAGMTASVKCGITAAEDASAYLICLGDQPGISSEVIDSVIAGARKNGKGIVLPTCGGKRGHPVYLDRAYSEEILALPIDRGLNSVTRGHPDDTLELAVEREAILEDMDTPADYRRELERMQALRGN